MWTTPRTWTAGDVLTATLFNQQIRDNLNSLRHCNDAIAIVYLSGSPTISTGTWTTVPFDTAAANAGGLFTAGSNRFEVPVTGKYELVVSIIWGDGNTGSREIRANRSDGLLFALHGTDGVGAASGSSADNAVTVLSCTAGQTVLVQVQHTKGSNLALVGSGDTGTRAAWRLIGE
jgi:hypothetical protein